MGISQRIMLPQGPDMPLLCGWRGLQWARGSWGNGRTPASRVHPRESLPVSV